MRTAVIVFPGSNCDRDLAGALHRTTGQKPFMVWHKETSLPDVDVIGLPGGFSYGDYLRCGAMAAHSPIMAAVKQAASRGVKILGICNGFQILVESGLLPGALLRNAGQQFVHKPVIIKNASGTYTLPIAHGEGRYYADAATLTSLKDNQQIAYTYQANPNGSALDIAGIYNNQKTILGMMPHPERAIDAALDSGLDGVKVLEAFLAA
jgi:phosphoribosylformylglycinamidine synthase subunit PurQ / glutaminase